MYKQYSFLGIVTARGGSKGLPGKNIKNLNGKPLIEWTLKQVENSKYIDEVFVSTDSEEIAEVSRQCGFDVPCLRPAYLAEDTTASVDVLLYTIQLLEEQGKVFDYILLLQPTSPLRKRNDIDEMIKMAGDHPERNGVISVGEIGEDHPAIAKKISASGNVIPYMETEEKGYQRQQFKKAYFPYGVGFLIKVCKLKECHNIYTDHMLPYYIERWQKYEIDDIYDFICVESIMKMEKDNM